MTVRFTRSPHLKDSALVLLHCLCKFIKDRFLLRFRFLSKAAAKVRTFSHILQIFSRFFSKNFSEEVPGARRAGKVGKPCGIGALNASSSVRQPFKHRRFLSESGCKGRGFWNNCKTLQEVFSGFWGSFFQFALIYCELQKQIFGSRENGTGKGTPNLITHACKEGMGKVSPSFSLNSAELWRAFCSAEPSIT